MAQYIGCAMLLSSTSSPDAGRVGELMILGPASLGGPAARIYDVAFVFLCSDDNGDSQVIRDHGMAIRRGNQLSFTQKDSEAEYVFELIDWELF